MNIHQIQNLILVLIFLVWIIISKIKILLTKIMTLLIEINKIYKEKAQWEINFHKVHMVEDLKAIVDLCLILLRQWKVFQEQVNYPKIHQINPFRLLPLKNHLLKSTWTNLKLKTFSQNSKILVVVVLFKL